MKNKNRNDSRRCYLVALTCLVYITSALVSGISCMAQGNREAILAELADEYVPGLLATYKDTHGNEAKRVDAIVSFQWAQQSPDTRLVGTRFEVTWKGFVFFQSVGIHTISMDCHGEVELEFQGRTVSVRDEKTGLVSTGPMDMQFGWHPITIRYKSTAEQAMLKLYWQGPAFQFEPIGYQFLYHAPDKSVAGLYRRGEHLAHALRCASCHSELKIDATLGPAPALNHMRDYLKPEWVTQRLQREIPSDEDAVQFGSRMPAFGFTDEQAKAITAYIFQSSTNSEPNGELALEGNSKAGKTVFASVGCVACHQADGLGESTLFDGGKLDDIAQKRRENFWQVWFENPARANSHHRMPTVDLTVTQRSDVIAYLKSLSDEASELDIPQFVFDEPLAAKGRKLYDTHGCASCHESKPLKNTADFDVSNLTKTSCMDTPNPAKQRPGYSLSADNKAALTLFLQQMKSATADSTQSLLVTQNNCLQCHARMDAKGLAKHLPDIGKQISELSTVFAALTPPSLNSVGDKLHDKALHESIQRKTAVRRPWLKVKMPKFSFTDERLHEISQWFVEKDRIPSKFLDWFDTVSPASTQPTAEELQTAGARLVTTDGFGCTSCHKIGSVQPPQAPLNAKGPDLSLLDSRIRKIWFSRWVQNPARIVPRMEMPSVQISVRGVLENHLPDQLEAVWKVLNTPGFEPPKPGAVRIARQTGVPEHQVSVQLLTDVLIHRDQQYIKPALVGMRNRHNLLFDMQHGTMLGWWQGDIARQRTKGKVWYWETDGASWGTVNSSGELSAIPDFRLQLADGQLIAPSAVGQFSTELDSWQQLSTGLRIRQRYRFKLGDRMLVVVVTQEFSELWPAEGSSTNSSLSGIQRKLWFDGVPANTQMVVGLGHQNLEVTEFSDHVRLVESGEAGRQWIELDLAAAKIQNSTENETTYQAVHWKGGGNENPLTIKYLSNVNVDRFPVVLPEFTGLEIQSLKIIPGVKAVRLPFFDEFMPTGIAWDPAGRMILTSLKGRVWQAVDTTGDGLEDRLNALTDELAAPYGVHASRDYIDVINKYALLRMYDVNHDGVHEKIETLASGWGHTADYHDWAVGVVPDGNGGYYISTPCQQDDRTLAGAALRGKVLQLVPRTPSRENPHRFSVKVVTSGHRFPMGIARNHAGEMFVTDNQGNYNPYNELNHIRVGAHFGFVNKIDRQGGPRPPLTAPAIDIPHPWTRSVNGICFLETPRALLQSGSAPVFGPFEGHLVGCEYDTRRLIRMSLQKVGDTYQGAAYPLTLDKPAVGEPLLGPLAVAVSPRGHLYVASIRDSGWGGANNIGTLSRMEFPGDLPVGIAEVTATATGFKIRFTKAVDAKRTTDITNYTIQSATRDSTTSYGGDDRDRRSERITAVRVSVEGRVVHLSLAEMRAGFVYDIRIRNLTPNDSTFFPAEAYYTLRKVPAE
jgi:mono/diheme cytochrome c family protein